MNELLTNPLTYIVGLIAILSIIEWKKHKNCSTKSCDANKTSYTKKPTYASSGLPKQKTASATKKTAPKKTAPKKPTTKKVAKKKVAKKTTPKKSVKKT
jgi:N-acetylmuramoyl-L-alanine amidase CwlA